MNLLTEPWMPVRKRDGSREWIAPNRLSDPEVVAFDADRADFNGALAQFAIGLLQTTTPVDSPIEWRRLFKEPPSAATLEGWFVPVISSFELDGDGARFMQDRTLRPKNRSSDKGEDVGDYEDIQQLLVDCAGEGEKVKDNTDHFIKRKSENFAMCVHCVATALYALQSGAPGGGRGYLTSIRGGGPLTTVIVCDDKHPLWRTLWVNTLERTKFLDQSGNKELEESHFMFPWMEDIRLLQPAGISAIYFEGEKGKPKPSDEEKPRTTPLQVHPFHVFWGIPRRIRLDFSTDENGVCGVCGRESRHFARKYVTKNYGLSYKGPWNHPFSPYYESKDSWLPFHPQPGGIGYHHWLGWVLGNGGDRKKERRACVVEHFLSQRTRTMDGPLRLWAFGYDMDNMKARCWYESTLPLYSLADCELEAQKGIEAEVGNWLAAADSAATYLRKAVKDAWFSRDARGDLSAVDAAFWSITESQFYAQLKQLIQSARDHSDHDPALVRESWLKCIAGAALKLFDEDFVGAGQVERQHPKRTATAFQQLGRNLDGSKMRQALGLPNAEKAKIKRSSKKRAAVV